MRETAKDKLIFFLMGVIIGLFLTVAGGIFAYKVVKGGGFHYRNVETRYEPKTKATKLTSFQSSQDKKAVAAKQLTEGFNVIVASSLDRVFQDGKTLLKPNFSDGASLTMAKNEYESFQVLIENGKDPLKDVEFEVSDLVNTLDGSRIERNNITWRVVGFVPTKKPYYPVKYVGLWPDPLLTATPTNIDPGITQPFWITVFIPKEAQAGNYKGMLYLRAQGVQPRQIAVNVKVYDFVLPRESHLKTAFDFYGHVTKDRYPQDEKETQATYQQRLDAINDKFIIEMLKSRMNPILNIDPSSQSSLGTVDHYRWFGLSQFSIGKYSGTFNNNWPEGDDELEKLISVYRGYAEDLKINKMLNMHYIYTWDEGEIGNPRVAKICAMIHQAHPELRNMVCYHGFWNPDKDPEWGKDIDIWTFQIDDFNEQQMNRLKEIGKEIWMYVSGPGGTGAPNFVIDSDAIDYRIIPWICWKYDIKGFLYWCVNWWTLVDPFRSAANTKWQQNGNGLIFYPGPDGPLDSVRSEIFRDGMEDYEYLSLLKEKVAALEQSNLKDSYPPLYTKAIKLLSVDKDLVSSPQSFNKESENLLKRRDDIAVTIEAIDQILTQKAAQ